MTRPEGNLFFALVLLHRVLFCRGRRFDWRLPALYLALYGPYYLWRYSYYGWPFPNTFYIKSSGGAGTFARGVTYLRYFARDYGAWFVLPLLVLPAPGQRRLWTLALVITGGFAAYVLKVGGDFMGLYRFLIPVLPLLALVAQQAAFRLPGRRAIGVGVGAVFLLSYGVLTARVSTRANTIERDDPVGSGIDMPAYLRRYTRDRASIGKWFAAHVRDDDLMSVGGAGAQVYYARVKAIDAFGLNDEYVAHKVPAHSTRPGHQKWAPDSYILSRKPTILCHHYKITATPYVPTPAEAQQFRSQGFRWVHVQIPGLSPPYYNFLLRRDRSLGPIEVDLSP
jgi:hypothetical protein